MQDRLREIYEEALARIQKADTAEELNAVRNSYLSKKSELMSFMGRMKNLVGEEKSKFGQRMNQIRGDILAALEEKKAAVERRALEERLKRESIDVTLPSGDYSRGSKHLFYAIVDEVSRIFIGMGYSVAEGPEIETDEFNFELLNVPKGHPAREMQDTFFIDENHLMRSQTSPVQARVMLASKGVGPIKIISPGKVYRRDDDATHSHQFGQIEGLVIDRNVTLSDLMGTLQLFARKMFGEKREVRMRSSYFPFTEPSVEVDISCFECGGKGCPLCKNTGWIEILGAGMVHPHVLEMCGFDTEVYQGFAFGVGIERVAMLKYGVDDIRRFYTNDLRFLKQFDKE